MDAETPSLKRKQPDAKPAPAPVPAKAEPHHAPSSLVKHDDGNGTLYVFTCRACGQKAGTKKPGEQRCICGAIVTIQE